MRSLLVTMFMLLLSLPQGQLYAAERMTRELGAGVLISFELPSHRWMVAGQAPGALVKETVEHVRYHFREDGREVPENLESSVRQRMAQNELFIFNPKTMAHLDIDLSPAKPGEQQPTRETIANSARYAAGELEQEKDLTEVVSEYTPADLDGAENSYRIDATYLKDGEPRTFIGFVGAVTGGWFFLYYTDKQLDPDDLNEIEALFKSFRFSTGPG